MKKRAKLRLSRETLRNLTEGQQREAVGGETEAEACNTLTACFGTCGASCNCGTNPCNSYAGCGTYQYPCTGGLTAWCTYTPYCDTNITCPC